MKTQARLRYLFAATWLAALPISAATAAAEPVATSSAKLTLPKVEYDKAGAAKLCRALEARPEYEKLRKKATGGPSVDALAKAVCQFYAVPKKAKKKYWKTVLAELVKRGKLTEKDQRSLSRLHEAPEATIAGWKPTTEFGHAVLAQLGDDDDTDTDSQASTAGDIGTLAGALLGGLGGNPASVAFGAAVGRLAGEVVDQLGQYANDLAPGDGPSEGEDGGEGEGEGGGDGGGDGGSP